MLIYNNVSKEEWSLILSALQSEYNSSIMSEIFPRRKDKIGELIKKIQEFKY